MSTDFREGFRVAWVWLAVFMSPLSLRRRKPAFTLSAVEQTWVNSELIDSSCLVVRTTGVYITFRLEVCCRIKLNHGRQCSSTAAAQIASHIFLLLAQTLDRMLRGVNFLPRLFTCLVFSQIKVIKPLFRNKLTYSSFVQTNPVTPKVWLWKWRTCDKPNYWKRMEQYYCKLVNHKGNCPLYLCVRAMGLFFCRLCCLFLFFGFGNATKIRCTAEKSLSLWGPCCMCFCISFQMTFNWRYVKNAYLPLGGTAVQFRPPVFQGEGEDLLFTGSVVLGSLWCGCYGFRPAITVAIRRLFVSLWLDRCTATPN